MQNKQLKSSPKKLEYMKKYRQDNLEKRSLYSKQYSESHKEQLKEYQKKYRRDNAKILSERIKKYDRAHKEERAAYQKIYRKDANNHIKHILCHREYTARLKIEVFKHYSPTLTCQHCGFSDVRALSLDHINGGGLKHKIEVNVAGGHSLYSWAKTHGYPPIFQVLCMNCQFIKRQVNGEDAWKKIKI